MKKHEYLLDDKCRAENIVYKCVASVQGYPNKVYLGSASNFKQHFYNHQMSFNNEGHSTDTFQICLGSKKKVQDNAITKTVHNQICTSLFQYIQEMSVVFARKI